MNDLNPRDGSTIQNLQRFRHGFSNELPRRWQGHVSSVKAVGFVFIPLPPKSIEAGSAGNLQVGLMPPEQSRRTDALICTDLSEQVPK
jgi:hypothetical protein